MGPNCCAATATAAAQELVGARNLVHSMVKASHVGPAAVELCHESRGVFTNSASSLSTGSFSLQVRAWSLQYPQRVYTRILSAPAATVEAVAAGSFRRER